MTVCTDPCVLRQVTGRWKILNWMEASISRTGSLLYVFTIVILIC